MDISELLRQEGADCYHRDGNRFSLFRKEEDELVKLGVWRQEPIPQTFVDASRECLGRRSESGVRVKGILIGFLLEVRAELKWVNTEEVEWNAKAADWSVLEKEYEKYFARRLSHLQNEFVKEEFQEKLLVAFNHG